MTYNVFSGTLNLTQSTKDVTFMHPPTVWVESIMFSRCPSGHPSICLSVHVLSVNTYNLYVLSGRLWMKLGTNIHHVSAHCWKGFQGQRSLSNRRNSKVKTRIYPNNLLVSTDVNGKMHCICSDGVASRLTYFCTFLTEITTVISCLTGQFFLVTTD